MLLTAFQVLAAQNSTIPHYKLVYRPMGESFPVPSADLVPQSVHNTINGVGGGSYVGVQSASGGQTPRPMKNGGTMGGPNGLIYGGATDVNESNIVVGYCYFQSPNSAVVWNSTGVHFVPVPEGTTESYARAVSDSGVIAGNCRAQGNHFFVVENGVPRVIGAAPSIVTRMRINNSGQITVAGNTALFYENGVWTSGTGFEQDINNAGTRVGTSGILRRGRPYKIAGIGPVAINSKDWVAGSSSLWTPNAGLFTLKEIGEQGNVNTTSRGIDDAGNIAVFWSSENNTSSAMVSVIGHYQVMGARSVALPNGVTASSDLPASWETADSRSLRFVRLGRSTSDPPLSVELEGQGAVLNPGRMYFRLVAGVPGQRLSSVSVSLWNWSTGAWETLAVPGVEYTLPLLSFTAPYTGTDLFRFFRQSDGRWRARLKNFTTQQGLSDVVDVDLACLVAR